ncbi:hypothetical protein HPB52_004483 [Rhipicephalus sanguineus]|uniref:Store-operated calcium entry-associated regulatory factor n=1 Tax=Rhipicephalus sanguineus TaxID=34632 RepID=A0A9D4SNM3_RHISA|nr:hypothetical protein HPB52_004483 [Rhipicephalus sanguineus]
MYKVVPCVLAFAGDELNVRDGKVLPLPQGQHTTGLPSHQVPQLNCRGGSAGCQDQPSVVEGYNRGSDGHDEQWECKAEMKETQKFGWMQVTCEGYNHPKDEYVLVGSCGLQYYLERTGPGPSLTAVVTVLVLAALVICCLYVLCDSPNCAVNTHRHGRIRHNHQDVPSYGSGYQPLVNEAAAHPSAPPPAPNPHCNPPPYNPNYCSASQYPCPYSETQAQRVSTPLPPTGHIHVLHTHVSSDRPATPGDEVDPGGCCEKPSEG